jgi:SAM-dependent methyltransferase
MSDGAPVQPPRQAERARADDWDLAYRRGDPPWEIGRPQPAFVRLADEGAICSPVLDSGCGTGEQALMLAARGLEVVGVDLAPSAIERARQKARERSLSPQFIVGDALELGRLGRQFSTVLDSGVFHVFDDSERARYVSSVREVLKPGGVLHLLCFSDQVPGSFGPRRVSQAELRAAFADGWRVERIDGTQFEVNRSWPMPEPPHAWLARIVRLPD